MSTIIYSVISSDKEFISYKKNYGSLIVPKHHKLVLIDNRSDKNKVLDIKSALIVKNQGKISLQNNIKLLLLKFNDEFFIRLDPDDYCYNDYVEKVSFFAKAELIVSGNVVVKYPNCESFILNKANGQYLNYEILGAGVVLHRKIILESLSISYNLFGQDNFAVWLVAKEQKISFLNIDSNYFYMQNNQITMSSNSLRIVSERLKLIRRKFKPKAIISIFYLRSISSKNKKFQIFSKHNLLSIKVFKFIFSFSFSLNNKLFKFSQNNIMSLQNSNNYYPIETIYLQEIFNVKNAIICKFDKSFKLQRNLYHKLSSASKITESIIIGF